MELPKGEIRIGAKVTLKEKESGEEFVYALVGGEESDPLQGKISVHSPLAQGILGLKVGKEAKIFLPDGVKVFKVLKIE